MSEQDVTVYGTRIEYAPGSLLSSIIAVAAPPNAVAAVSERFCPACLVPFGGNPRIWCPQCKTFWHLRTAAQCEELRKLVPEGEVK